MGFLDFLHGKKEKLYSVEQAPALLTALLKERGFFMDGPDLAQAWEVFKEFCLEYHFKCDDDAVLWEVGPYCRQEEGGRAFQWHMVRQFTCGAGEDDDMRQITFDVNFEPGKPEEFSEAQLWTCDFGDNFQAFFTGVETHPAFTAHRGLKPVQAQVYLDEV